MKQVFASCCLLLGLSLFAPGKTLAENAVAADPVAAILEAFDDHAIVALGEGNHGNIEGHEFRLRLIRDPRFAERVDDIVVEFGNSRFQDTIDRYIGGDDVPRDELRKVWEDTAQANPVWDVPIYEEFFGAVREVNMALPAERPLRVVLGDVPFDWEEVRTVEDYNRQPQRSDVASAAIIHREVLDKNRRALVIFGDLHLLRKPLVLQPRDAEESHSHVTVPEPSIVMLLEKEGSPVYSVYTNTFANLAAIEPDAAEWQEPRLVVLASSAVGRQSFAMFQPAPQIVAGRWMVIDPEHSPAIGEQFDAMLFLGPPAQISYATPPASLCSDHAYLDMRFARMTLLGFAVQVEQAKQLCRMIGARP